MPNKTKDTMLKNNKTSQSKRLGISITVFSILQIASYIFLIFIIYSTNHDNSPNDYDWMGGFFPAMLFVIFGSINLILVSIYITTCIIRKRSPDKVIALLVTAVVILTLFSGPIVNFIESL